VDVPAGVHPLPPEAEGTALVLAVELEPGTASRCGLQVRVGDEERTVVGYDAVAGELYVDRTCSGVTSFHPGFAAVHRAPLAPRDGLVRLEVLVDAASVEVFGGAGEVTISDQVFPAPESRAVAVFAERGTAHLRRLTVTPVPATRAGTVGQEPSASTVSICESAADARSGRVSR
jgi:sucrose-6-phosphate hydrolase SacC (GH32 family)